MTAIETRSSQRESVYLLATMSREPSSCPDAIKLRNLSNSGMMMTCDGSVAVGDAATFHLSVTDKIGGTVVWIDGRRSGIVFDHPIDPHVFRRRVFWPDREAPRYARSAIFPRASGSRYGAVLPV